MPERRKRDLPPIPAGDPHQVYTVDEVASRLKMGRSTFDKAWHAGELPGPDIRRGAKYVRWSHDALTEALKQVREPAVTAQ